MALPSNLRAIKTFVNFCAMGTLPSPERASQVGVYFDALDQEVRANASAVKAIIAEVARGILPSHEVCSNGQEQVLQMLGRSPDDQVDLPAPSA